MYHHTLEEGFKYRPDYKWPEPGTKKDCPRSGENLELIENKKTLAVAESCTGGYLSKIITDIPGSSMYYKGGIVAYDNDIKINVLNVKNSIISKHGAVSKQVATIMSENIRKKYKSEYGISTTGISGPGGGSDEKPVGLIYISISSKFEIITK